MRRKQRVLLTGGAGYIGSHSAVAFHEAGYEVLLLDNYSNSSPRVVDRLQQILGTRLACFEVDLRYPAQIDECLAAQQPDAVIHFAGLKSVGESVAQPLEYYDNNVVGTLNLLRAMRSSSISRLVFSSSATVYGDPASVPIREDARRSATNPYGRSKLMIEDMLMDLAASSGQWSLALLRYFNPVGAHPSGLIGEDPSGVPSNLMPFLTQVAVGRRERLSVFGNDYPTSDGTGVRDYIHVSDLAAGHVHALRALEQAPGDDPVIVNLGTGRGYSVLELLRAFETACNREIPFEFVARRPGDIAECYADPSYAQIRLGWQAAHGIERMCEDSWRWQSQNPNGFTS